MCIYIYICIHQLYLLTITRLYCRYIELVAIVDKVSMANTQTNVKSITGLYYNIENHENMPLTTVYLGSFSEVPVFGRVPNLQMIDDYIITARP